MQHNLCSNSFKKIFSVSQQPSSLGIICDLSKRDENDKSLTRLCHGYPFDHTKVDGKISIILPSTFKNPE